MAIRTPLKSLQKGAACGSASFASFALALVHAALLFGSGEGLAQAAPPIPPKPGVAKSQSPRPSTGPDWSELTPAQQIALGPLASTWSSISEAQKRKWIALSRNYPNLSASERATLHGRMTEWAALSPAQRSQARLNFAQTKNLSTEEKKAQWEAYQALSPEQKKQLAAEAQVKPGAATAVTPVAPNKLAAVPITRSEASRRAATASKPRATPQDGAGTKSVNSATAASAPARQP